MHSPPTVAEKSRTIFYAGAAVVLCCLLSSGHLLVKAPSPGHLHDPYRVKQLSDERFADLEHALPRTGVVGYVGGSSTAALGDYYLTEYALAPLVVDYSTDHAIVIGNFPSEAAPHVPDNLELIKDFGAGVFLFANKGAK